MSDQFKEQGGAATMDPSKFRRWLTSHGTRLLVSEQRLANKQKKLEQQRASANGKHIIEYFHQVEDGYSHLAAQTLQPLLDHYDIELVCHLVTESEADNLPEPDLLLKLSSYDSSKIACHYGLEFQTAQHKPEASQIKLAQRILANAPQAQFASIAVATGKALWAGQTNDLAELAKLHGVANDDETKTKTRAGNDRRLQLKHYSGAMFYYAETWYWGVDRLYHLEKRLAQYQANKNNAATALFPRPDIEVSTTKDNGSITLEFYPSMRSPYTSIIYDKTLQFAKDSGINLVLRPVLPMVMRGVPATMNKGKYIMSDTVREGRTLGLSYGPGFYDPIGEPVRRCYSLYNWACQQNKGGELLASFLQCAFFKGVNTNSDSGMQRVVEDAGLSWQQALTVIDNKDWQQAIENNRQAMYDFGSWGVPSYRLLDAQGEEVLALWGQDRLWLFAREIKRLVEQS